MTTQEIAERLVELCRTGQYGEAQKELYADNAVSIEPAGSPNEKVEGLEGIIRKGEEFSNMIEQTFGGEVSDPLVAGNYFSVRMSMDVQFKGMGRIQMEEICVYEVNDGKIVLEQFYFNQG